MFDVLFSHFALTGIALTAILAFVGVGMFAGWGLVLNKYVIGALIALLAIISAILWWEVKKESLRKDGASECHAEHAASNRIAHDARLRQKNELIAEISARETDLKARLSVAESALFLAQQNRERKPNVTPKADAGCVLTLGFVRDYDASLPASARRADVSFTDADNDKPSGIPLSVASTEIGRNNASCAACVERLNTCEDRRYQACLAWDKRFGLQSGCAR